MHAGTPAAASGAPRGPPGRVSQAIRGYCCCYCCCYCYSCCRPQRRPGAAATPAFLLSSSGSPGPDPRGPLQASLKTLRSDLCSHTRPPRPPIATQRRRSSERGCRDSAPCVAGRGRGAWAPPAPGMRARALASTSLLPLSRLEPPLADSGEREGAGQPARRAPGPGASGNVSRAVSTLLGVSPALERRAAPRRDGLGDLELGGVAPEPCCLLQSRSCEP